MDCGFVARGETDEEVMRNGLAVVGGSRSPKKAALGRDACR
jgi:hypothetical protein